MIESTNEKPTKRILNSRAGVKLVVELWKDCIVIRPKGTRKDGPAEIRVGIDAIYDRALLQRAAPIFKRKS